MRVLWVGGTRRTVPLSLLPFSFDVVLPERDDGGEDLLLRIAFVPKTVKVGISLRDAWRESEVRSVKRGCSLLGKRSPRTYENFLSHKATQLPGPIDGIPFAQYKLKIIRNG